MDEPINWPNFKVGALFGAALSSALWGLVVVFVWGLGNREMMAYRHAVDVHLSNDARGQAMYDRCVARLAVYEPPACAVSP